MPFTEYTLQVFTKNKAGAFNPGKSLNLTARTEGSKVISPPFDLKILRKREETLLRLKSVYASVFKCEDLFSYAFLSVKICLRMSF